MNGVDPLELKAQLWPDVVFYKEQKAIIRSVWDNDETYVPAANKMGKDFVAGFIVLAFFLTRKPCRIVTTSAKDDHLRVLWGEIGRFIDTSRVPLDVKQGGPLSIKHQELKWALNGRVDKISYVIGMVANEESIAAMQGHHANPDNVEDANDGIPRTLFVSDESSSVKDAYYTMASTWMQRALIFGNTWPCTNFFYRGVTSGDMKRPNGRGYIRKVVRIKAEQSPNVRLGLIHQEQGREPTDERIIPGVKTYSEYVKNRLIWDRVQQAVSLDAEFYEGEEEKLFPPSWLIQAEERAAQLPSNRKATHIGVDPAEGGDLTSMVAIDKLGVIEQVSKRTPDTSVIPDEIIEFMRKHGVAAENVLLDRGGGGKQHADSLRKRGYRVRTVAFGEALKQEIKRGLHLFSERKELEEERYVYKNRRAEMYGEASILLNPGLNEFAIPKEILDWRDPLDNDRPTLRRQLTILPKWYDEEGRLYIPPKRHKPDSTQEIKKKTLIEMLGGYSPDEADALVLAVHGLMSKPMRKRAGAAW